MSVQVKSLNIMQWNARSAIANKISLTQFLSDNNIHVALISETWFKPNQKVNFPGYNLVRKDRADGKAGTAVLIKKQISFKEILFNNTFNDEILVCGITTVIDSTPHTLVSLYRPPNVNTNVNDWNNIFSQCSNPLLIGGDFNAHNTLWGSFKNDSVGQQILNSIDTIDLIILNSGGKTRLTAPGVNKSVVDITMASPNLAGRASWNVCADTLGSDHFPILINLTANLSFNNIIYPKSKWNTDKANWTLYEDILQTEFQNPPLGIPPSEKYKFFIENINIAADRAIPVFKPLKIKKRPPPPWWDEECDRVLKQRKEAFKEYKQNCCMENFITCKKKIALSKKVFKRKARENWKNFCENLNHSTPSNVLWSQTRKLRRIPTNSGTNPLSKICLESLFDQIAPPSVSSKPLLMPLEEPLGKNLFDHPFTMNELKYAIKMAPNTSPGIDDVKYPMLLHMPPDAKKYLLDIYNDIWIKDADIEALKTVLVVPILKPGKDPGGLDAYRPISLLSCVLKTFERMIKNRLEWWFNFKATLPSCQFGFKKGLGTLDAVSYLVTDIQNNFSNNTYLAALFIDLKGAYNWINLDILVEEIKKFSIPDRAAKNITKLYRDRLTYIRGSSDEKLGPRVNTLGLPQGSVLSPILFNIYTSGLHNIINHTCSIIQYADDFCFYLTHKKYDTCIKNLSYAGNLIKEWYLDYGLEVSVEKSVTTVFTRHNTPNISSLKLADYNFPYKNYITYLGVTLDKKLNWGCHIDRIISKCEKGINFLKSITKTWWGANPNTLLLFYQAYIRSIIDYGSILYGSASDSNLKRIDTVQNKALRICIGAMKSTPLVPLHVETLEPPLQLRRQYLSEKFILKAEAKNLPIVSKIHHLDIFDLTNKYWSKKNSPPLCNGLREVRKDMDNIFKILPTTYVDLDFFDLFYEPQIIIPIYSESSHMSNLIVNNIKSRFHNYIQIYTDASKISDNVGCAFLVPSNKFNLKVKLNESSSVFTGEAIAILKAMEYIKANNFNKAIIYTDSMSVLESLKNSQKFSPMTSTYILEIYLLLCKLYKEGICVVLVWVKAHVGITYNERVDELAKISATSGFNFGSKDCLLDCFNKSKKRLTTNWTKLYSQFKTENPNNRFIQIEDSIPQALWYDKLLAPRKFITTISRIRFGHACFAKHLKRLGVVESDICTLCNTVSDLDHIFFGCQNYTNASAELVQKLSELNVSLPINLLHLLSLKNMTIYKLLVEYLNKIGKCL